MTSSVPMEEKVPVIKLVFCWLDKVTPGRPFGPRELQSYVRRQTNGEHNPQDGTITRYIRAYNAQGGRIKVVSRSKSLYAKALEWEQGELQLVARQGARA